MGFSKICVGSATCDWCGVRQDWRNESARFGTEFSRSTTASLARAAGWSVPKDNKGKWICPRCMEKEAPNE